MEAGSPEDLVLIVSRSFVAVQSAIFSSTYPGGKVHKEIFTFVRPKSGKYKDKEWELLVWEVIQKWGKFVQLYV